MLACRTHGRAGPFAQWAWVLDVLLCSAAAGRWTRIPGEKDAQLCQRSDLETRSKMPPAKRRPFRLRTSFRGCPVPDLEPSWLHLVKGSRRGPQQVAVWQGLAALPWAAALRTGVGPCHLWGSCTQQRVRSAKYPTPLACQPAPHSAHGNSGKGRPFPPRISSLPQPSHPTPNQLLAFCTTDDLNLHPLSLETCDSTTRKCTLRH
jgi:hypothetical protein